MARAVLRLRRNIGEYVFAAALDGELALLKGTRSSMDGAAPGGPRAVLPPRTTVVVSTRLGSVVAFNHSGSERWSRFCDGDDGGGTSCYHPQTCATRRAAAPGPGAP